MTIKPASGTTARLIALDPLARSVIMYLRLLRSGSRGRDEVEQDIEARAGPGGEHALGHLEHLQSLICHAVRRPLDIASVAAVTATADEMMVANLVRSAAVGRSVGALPPCGAGQL